MIFFIIKILNFLSKSSSIEYENLGKVMASAFFQKTIRTETPKKSVYDAFCPCSFLEGGVKVQMI